jgi:signal transduction histidine kinase
VIRWNHAAERIFGWSPEEIIGRPVPLVPPAKQARRRARRHHPAGTRETLERIGEELALALAELRELARGLHPAILTDKGLAAVLETLAGRSAVPVAVTVSPLHELPEAIEAAAYYVIAEALANVAKHAKASGARIYVALEDGRVVIEVADDGVGGADFGEGSGLRRLADRVEALGGRLDVRSPRGEGTLLRAEIPCEQPDVP